ncbi:MAG: DivIVA domain-containing protein [Frankiaceae bacterium]|nr:DivIVA domain-containing protein [Frankiaceae bacterium]
MDDDQLVPLSDDDQPNGFDVVLRGYDRRQVDDYLDRVETALNEADARHAEDAGRLAALESQVTDMHERLADAERRAAGRPEPAPVAGDRIAAMLRLAEEEAESMRTAATDEAERIVADAQLRAGLESAKQSSELDRREQEITARAEEAAALRQQAQQEADAIRARAEDDAVSTRQQAQEELRRMHEAGQLEAAAMTSEARRQVEELSRQRDGIAAQLQSLRDTLSGAVAPLSAPVTGAEPTQAIQLPAHEARTEPGA